MFWLSSVNERVIEAEEFAGGVHVPPETTQVLTTLVVVPVSAHPPHELQVPELQVRERACSRSQVCTPVYPDGHVPEVGTNWVSVEGPEQEAAAQVLTSLRRAPVRAHELQTPAVALGTEVVPAGQS